MIDSNLTLVEVILEVLKTDITPILPWPGTGGSPSVVLPQDLLVAQVLAVYDTDTYHPIGVIRCIDDMVTIGLLSRWEPNNGLSQAYSLLDKVSGYMVSVVLKQIRRKTQYALASWW